MVKKIIILIFVLTLIVALSGFTSVKNTEKVVANPYTSAQAAVLMEKNSQRILFQKNMDLKLPMASCTKILTALTVVENCNVEETVTVPQQAVGIEGSSIYLRAGEKLTVKELLYGLLLRSGNDSAVALALHVSGSLEDFRTLMNATAKKYGANDSNFVTPHGLDAKDHYTTAYDLAKISCFALKNPTIAEIVSSKSAKIGNEEEGNFRLLYNKNKLLNNYSFADGVKTGYTKKAGRCFVGSATKDGMQLVCVVLNCGPMFEETQSLLQYGFCNYRLKTIVPKNKVFKLNCPDGNEYYRCEEQIAYPLKSDGTEDKLIGWKLSTDEGNLPVLEINFKNKLLFCRKLSII